jgi:sulfite exporter TauE/SafE
MVYVALFGAVAMQSPTLGILYMILFGLGTIPLMSSVVYLKNFITNSLRNKIQKAIPFIAVFIAILFILRGLGLGIPYISPSNTSLYIQQQPNCQK